MIRLLDILFSILGILFCAPIFIVIFICGLFDTGSPLFFQKRVGKYRSTFVLVKFRTMSKGTGSVATHLSNASSVTFFGGFLRRTKLDELPQLWNVLKGEMSLVGPRPCLVSQVELIAKREHQNVFDVRPGITGLAQINNVDMSDPEKLAAIDAQMINTINLNNYLLYIVKTVFGKGAGDNVKER